MKKKRVVSILLSGLIVLSVVSCSKGNVELSGAGDISSSVNSEIQEENENIENMTATQLSTEADDQTDENSDQDSQEEEPAEEPSYFTEVSEEVWATGTVNIRLEPSMEGEVLGQFNQGDSTIRTGIGLDEYSEWSRVELDGKVVYVATSYLSTSKVNPPSTNTQQSSQPQSSSTSSSSSSSSSSSQQKSGGSSLDEINRRNEAALEAVGGNGADFAPPPTEEELKRIEEIQKGSGFTPIYEEDGTITGWESDIAQ